MREIKFRAWDSLKKRWFYNIQDVCDIVLNYAFRDFLKSENAIVEEYTGIKDKNGVAIYENDIVKTVGENIYVVEFFDGKFNPISDFKDGVWEVIGNVHQNSDLLAADIERMIPDDIGNDIHEFLHGGDK